MFMFNAFLIQSLPGFYSNAAPARLAFHNAIR